MKHALAALLLFVPLLQAQTPTGSGTANYIAKWSSSSNLTTSALCQSASGGLVGIATCFPTQRLQVNSGDALIKGLNNFTASGQVARYFIGDTNHAVGAAYGSGLFFNTYKAPNAMVIFDQTGWVVVKSNLYAQFLFAGSSNQRGGLNVSGDAAINGTALVDAVKFPDGTVQTTAYTGATATTRQAAINRQLQRDRDNLVQLVRQLQARVDRLEKAQR
jgi:hypothetical protein